MKKLRVLGPVIVIVTMLLLMIAPLGASAEPLNTAGGSGCSQFYTVHRGDTLAKIAAHFGTTVWQLARLNGIANPNVIYVGQTLCIKAGGPPPPPPPHNGFWYMVRCGDTLSAIAHRFGWGVGYLASVNHIANPNLIYAGQRLWIPAHR